MYAYIDTGMCVYIYYRQMYAYLCMCKAYLYKMYTHTSVSSLDKQMRLAVGGAALACPLASGSLGLASALVGLAAAAAAICPAAHHLA